MIYLYSFGSVLIISLVSLFGLFTISIREDLLKKYVFALVSLAVGALLGDAFIHLIPESFEIFEGGILAPLLIIFGVIIFFALEKFFHWHHHYVESDTHIHPVGKMVLVSDGLHNLIDGIIIGASYLISIEIGIATTLAVILHEIPQEIGDFGVLIHSGYTKGRALFLNFISALLSVIGVVFVFLLGNFAEQITQWFIPIAAGGFIYIAIADLMPELQKTENKSQSFFQILFVLFGVALMWGLIILE